MNDADKNLIDAWRTKASLSYREHCCHDGRWTTYRDLFAAFDRAMAHTPTLVNVGVNYCTVHHGIINEDDGPVCDFAGHNRRGSDEPCDLRPLGYVS